MSVYMTEAEQLEAIKNWWKRYSNVITVALSILLLAISAYKYWNWHEAKIAQQASNTYEHLMVAFSNQDNKGVRGYATQLLTDYNQTVYADAARLTLAKLYASREKYAKAEEELAYVAAHSKMDALQQIAKIRLARLLAAEKSYTKALDELSKVNSSVYMPVVNELKGDIYAATGHYQQAVKSYKKAISEVQMNGMGNLFLEMKTNELASMTQSVKIEAGKTHKA
jgi:predicted negative regulator of RcsB-dependent stress response